LLTLKHNESFDELNPPENLYENQDLEEVLRNIKYNIEDRKDS
jgi:hypothetical protein